MAAKALELRKLMKQQKSSTQSKKINHPLAKYNNLDQLVCKLCNNVIKNEIIWTSHLQSKRHKENVALLKNNKPVPAKSAKDTPIVKAAPLKGILKKEDSYELPEKKLKESLPSDFFDTDIKANQNTTTSSTLIKSNEPVGNESVVSTSTMSVKTDKQSEEVKESSSKKRKLSSTSTELPEGFFDDPKLDAKARHIEYKDPKEVEWEKFQKMIQEETKISENIQEEEDEESEMLKDMAEYNNMKSCLSRVQNLKKLVKLGNQKKAEQNVKTSTVGHADDDDDDDVDANDEEMCDLFDWRAKMA